ncbi:MAG: hypothetical protein KDK70_36035 [Myxococcales bacterium]|nr:hypothetical protein [Myxococcales bacterium]
MPRSSIKPASYLRVPRINVASGLTLARALLAAVPERPSPEVLAAARALQADADALQAQWMAKQSARSAEDVRPYDHRLDRAWSVIERILACYSIFAPTHPGRVRADELHALLFPTGLTFTQLPYMEEHAQSDQRLSIIDEDGLSEDLERLVGRVFVHELRRAHEAYGAALDITRAAPDEAPAGSLLVPLRALRRAISSYTLLLLAFAELDPDRNTESVRRALAPIDAQRSKNARRRSGAAEAEPTPDHGSTVEEGAAG